MGLLLLYTARHSTCDLCAYRVTMMCDHHHRLNSLVSPRLSSLPVSCLPLACPCSIFPARIRDRPYPLSSDLVHARVCSPSRWAPVNAHRCWHSFALGCAASGLPFFALALLLAMGLRACYIYP